MEKGKAYLFYVRIYYYRNIDTGRVQTVILFYAPAYTLSYYSRSM